MTRQRKNTMASRSSARNMNVLLCLIAIMLGISLQSVAGFTITPSTLIRTSTTVTSTQRYFFGQPKDDGSPGDYVCKDCGYVFTKGPQAWAALPDNYKCPPCGAPKFRFKKVPKGSASGTKVEVKKKWF